MRWALFALATACFTHAPCPLRGLLHNTGFYSPGFQQHPVGSWWTSGSPEENHTRRTKSLNCVGGVQPQLVCGSSAFDFKHQQSAVIASHKIRPCLNVSVGPLNLQCADWTPCVRGAVFTLTPHKAGVMCLTSSSVNLSAWDIKWYLMLPKKGDHILIDF